MQDFELTDELYVKMNARGKSLTPFENFKSWLMKENSTITIPKWKTNLDIAWNDIFWQKKDIGETKIDDQYLQFFKNMFLGDYLLSRNGANPGHYIIVKDENIDELRQNVKFNPIPLFETEAVFAKNIESYLNVLRAFEDTASAIYYNKRFIEKPVSTFLFKDNIGLNWWDTTYYFALTRYIINNNDLKYLSQWSRVISNLIYNTPIESPKLYIDACESINQLLETISGNNIYEEIARLTPSSIDFFAEKQKDEEIQKSKLIIDHPAEKWEDLFIELENHEYFYGQVGFLFNISKSAAFNDFRDTSKMISALFSKALLEDGSYVLFRCLLTFKNCFIESNSNLIYPSNARGTLRNRNENWRRFFDTHSDAVKLLVIHKTYDCTNPLQSLLTIIKEEKGKTVSFFYSKLVTNPDLFDYPKQNVLRNYGKNYYLLNSSRIFGYFVELETYNWFLKNVNGCNSLPNYTINYEYVKGRDNEPGVILKKGRSKKLLLKNHQTGKFYFTNDKINEYTTITKAISTLPQ